MSASEEGVVYPPKGFWIGVFNGRQHGAIGPYATEAEARQALTNACIFVTSQHTAWDTHWAAEKSEPTETIPL